MIFTEVRTHEDMKSYWVPAAIILATTLFAHSENVRSQDGSIVRDGSDWVLSTSQVEKRVRLFDGHLLSTGLRNQTSGRDYQSNSEPSPEITFT
jgi:hypothetical protein